MTAIFTLACPAYSLQVSDRLVSLRYPGDPKLTDFDLAANKALLFQAHDGLVCIGYAGTAYLDGVPTDKWIAEKLWNQQFPVGSDGRTPIQFGHNQNICKLDFAIWKLKCDLETLELRGAELYITIAGWQMRRKILRPVLVELENRRGSSLVRIARGDKYWTPGVNDFRLNSIGAHPDREEVQQLKSNLREKGLMAEIGRVQGRCFLSMCEISQALVLVSAET